MKKKKHQKNKLNMNFFISLFIFLATLMTLLFARMEMKRKSYEIYKLSSDFKVIEDEYLTLYSDYSEKVSDQNIMQIAESKLAVHAPNLNQVVNLDGQAFLISSK